MSAQENMLNDAMAATIVATPVHRDTRPFYWAVKRELWEHRALYITPMVIAGVVLLGVLLSVGKIFSNPQILLAAFEPAQQRAAITGLYGSIGGLMGITMVVVAWVYCLSTMQRERRDRSILFWKSLPVSDLTTVLAKLFVPMAAAPVIFFVGALATMLLMSIVTTLIVLAGGANPAPLWSVSSLFQVAAMLLYVFAVVTLWYAPVYSYLMLVSGWSRRSAFLWLLPPVALGVIEQMAFETHHVFSLLRQMLSGGLAYAFSANAPIGEAGIKFGGNGFRGGRGLPENMLQFLDPVKFLSTPELWYGLVAAAAMILATVWMRRYREPM